MVEIMRETAADKLKGSGSQRDFRFTNIRKRNGRIDSIALFGILSEKKERKEAPVSEAVRHT